MRKNKKKKGYLYTIEVMIVVAVIAMAAAFIFRYPLNAWRDDTALIKQQGMSALSYLAGQNLREMVYRNISAISSQLNALLPSAIESGVCVDCDATVPSDRSVVFLAYYLAGDDTYSPRTLKVYLWRK